MPIRIISGNRSYGSVRRQGFHEENEVLINITRNTGVVSFTLVVLKDPQNREQIHCFNLEWRLSRVNECKSTAQSMIQESVTAGHTNITTGDRTLRL